MIEYLKGNLLKKDLPHIILNVNGIGYGVEVPASAFAHLGHIGDEAALWIYTRVKEDVLKLYGFSTWEDRKVFDILLEVNGVGPKVALAILSTLSVSQLLSAIERKEPEFLVSVPGIGKRSAEKIVVELQSKVEKFLVSGFSEKLSKVSAAPSLLSDAASKDPKFSDLSSALENLGFKKKQYLPVVEKLSEDHASEDFTHLMRRALADLKPMDKNATRDMDSIF